MNVKTTSSIALAGNKFNTSNNKCKPLRGKHPLKQYKFYLDIQSSQTSTKIEQLIKELGGNLEFFWTREVTHFVTDKEIHENQSALNGTAPHSNNGIQSVNSNYSDGSLNSPSVTNDFNKTTKPRSHSRANAMLHKARRETNDINATQQDRITSKAKELGTVIWHTNYTLKFLKKLLAELALINKEKNNNSSIVNNLNSSRDTVELKEPFIKIESVERSYRPFYKELQKSDFTILKIRNQKDKEKAAGGGVGADQKKMTRKSRSSSKHRPQNHVNIKTSSKVVSSSEKQCGYCELCKVEYDVLKTHLKTDEHCCFVKNHQNFLVLDTLIKNGANVNKFLNRDLSEQYSPTKQENKITTLKSPRQLRQTATRLSKNAINQTSDNDVMNMSAASPAIEKVKKQICKDSPPIRHTLQNSMLYKVVDEENTKTNDDNVSSTGKPNKMETRNNPKGGDAAAPIIVKIRKIRQSELTLLNGEAVNFMFPKKRRGSTEMTDVDRQTTSDNSRLSSSSIVSELDNDSSFHAQTKRRKQGATSAATAADNSLNINNKASACNKTTDDNLEDSSLIGKRTTVTTLRASSPPTLRKSRTSTIAALAASSATPVRSPVSSIRTRRQCVTGIYKELDEDEILLMDELLLLEDVSQPPPTPVLEKPNPRRRRGRSVAPRCREQTPDDEVKEEEKKARSEPDPVPVQPKIPSLLEASDKLKESVFSFERIPSSEQWYKVFQRQDNCQQRIFEYYGNTDYRKLPYELGAQTIKEPKFPCFLCPKKEEPGIKKEEKAPLPTPSIVGKPSTAPPKADKKSEKTVTAPEAKHVPKDKDSKKSSRPKPKAIFKKAWLFETPRKSPRVHASTLAILSCLLRQQETEHPVRSPSPHSSPSKSNKSSPVKQLSSSPVKEEKTDSSSVIEPPSSPPPPPPVVVESIPTIRRESIRFKESGGSSSDTPPPIIKHRKRRQPRQEIVHTPIPQEEDGEGYRSIFQQEKEINDFIANEFSSPFTCDNSFQEELDKRSAPSSKSKKSSSSVDKDFDFSHFSSSHYSLVDLVTDSDSINFSKFYMNPRAGISRNYNVRRNNSAVPGGLFMVAKKRKNNRTGWPKNKKRPAANNRRCKVFTFNNRLKKIIPGLMDEATNASTVTSVSSVDSVSAEKFETPCPTPMDLEDTEFNVSSDSLDGSTTTERPPSSVPEKLRLKVPTVRLRRFNR